MRGAVEIEQLVRAHQGTLLRYLRYLGAEESVAQDVAQDTFIALLQSEMEVREHKATSGWLRTTARNFYFMHLRRQKRAVALPDEDILEATWCEEEGEHWGEEYRRALANCLQGLTDRARLALKLRYGDEASREEISFAVGLDAEGAKTLLRRAKDKLRECIRKQVGDGQGRTD